jgi:hypothetical protein
MGLEEDALNKPWRPLPSKRLAMSQALLLRWSLFPACLLLSIYFDVFIPGVALSVGIWLHNELRFDSHWFTRNVTNALGYLAFGSGASILASGECT